MSNVKNSVGVFVFVFLVAAISALVGVSLYHCLSKQHIGGLDGNAEASGKSVFHVQIKNVAFIVFFNFLHQISSIYTFAYFFQDDNLVMVLHDLQLDDYLSTFEKNKLDYEGFLELNDNELREMSIPIGPRKKIAKKIQELKKHPLSKKN